jgi:hypothetical protein
MRVNARGLCSKSPDGPGRAGKGPGAVDLRDPFPKGAAVIDSQLAFTFR